MRKITVFVAMTIWAAIWGLAATAQAITISALGDSLVQGYGLKQEDGFVPQMQAWLDRAGAGVTLINAGVSGDTTAGGAARVAWTLTPEVDALIVVLGGNDVLRGFDPGVTRRNLEAILKTAQAGKVAVLLVGLRAPGNYGPDYKTEFDAIYPALAARYDTLFVADFFAAFGGSGGDPSRLRGVMQADGIHPNPEGVRRIVEEIGPEVLRLAARVRRAR
jgi:acyl-CoA thioesterase I